jgi:hypothetical protein
MRKIHWLLILGLAVLLSSVNRATMQEAGTVVKAADSPVVYRVMENGERRPIADWATFLAWGFQPGEIVTLSNEEITAMPLGEPLTRWIVSSGDLYFMLRGERHLISDQATFQLTGGRSTDITMIDDALMAQIPVSNESLIGSASDTPPALTVSIWFDGLLWVADESGSLTRWDGTGWQAVTLPEPMIITALLADGDTLYAGTESGALWRLLPTAELVMHPCGNRITAIEGNSSRLWLATAQRYNWETHEYRPGAGLLEIHAGQSPLMHPVAANELTSLVVTPEGEIWIGTGGHGLLRYESDVLSFEDFPDYRITSLALGSDGVLWGSSSSGVVSFQGSVQKTYSNVPSSDLVVDSTGRVWLAGLNGVGLLSGSIYDAMDHPLLLDHFAQVVLDDEDNPWFVGQRRVLHLDASTNEWTAIDRNTSDTSSFDPANPVLTPVPDFPDPGTAYEGWPHPDNDNGRCMHYLQYPAGDIYEIREQIARLQTLGIRWVLVNYTDQSQLRQMAPLFAQADILVIWRPFLRPYQPYSSWAEDVRFLRALGLPPYIQVYNEPSLEVEWDGQAVDQALFLQNLAEGVRAVYDAGGYPGLQTIDPEWTRASLQYLKSAGLDYTFDRLWYAIHMYGSNHPPEYDDDIYSVIGSLQVQAQVFEDELGFVPPFIAGEGGWRLGEASDTRYPAISEQMHADYYVAVFEWFETGQLSNGESLPDYLFAFCPWLLSDPWDPAAWYDSASGDRTLTIQAVEALDD